MITLYDCSTAPSPRRARMALAEKGLAYRNVQIDLRQGEQLGEAFRALNPLCTVPALVTDEGVLLPDNAAIVAWADALVPEPPLLGRGPLERGEVAHWVFRAEFEGLMAVAEAFRNSSPAMAGRALPGPMPLDQIPALAQRGRARTLRFFDTLEQRLAGREWLAGEHFSWADITAWVTVEFARVVKLQPPASHGALQRWRAAVALRPSAQA